MSAKDHQQQFVEGLRSKLGLEATEVYESAPKRIRMLRNQLWQGQPAKKRFPLGLVFAKTPNDVTLAVKHALLRLTPVQNGFDAVCICEKDENGHWAPSHVIERLGHNLSLRLKQLAPQLTVTRAAPRFSVPEPPPIGPSTDQFVVEVVRQVRQNLNVILQGPPGTGKTFMALQAAKMLAGAGPEPFQLSTLLRSVSGGVSELVKQLWFKELPLVWEVVQAHPGYTYDDFVRGRTLVADASGSRFESVDRIIPELATVARHRVGKPTLLIIDEINRCNLANVLGELIFALEKDKRGQEVKLQYDPPPGLGPGEGVLLALPKDLLVLGTMNTADRSIALVDYAIRRRFRFIDVLPDGNVIAEYYSGYPKHATRAEALFSAAADLVSNQRMQIGHSYFLSPPDKEWPTRLANRVAYEVLPLLREYRAEGHLHDGSGLALPGGPMIEIEEGGIDLGDTRIRDEVRRFLAA